MIFGLTRRQTETYDFLKAYRAENGYSPNYNEIQKHLGLASRSGVARIVNLLEQRGVVRRIPNSARSLMPTNE